MRRKELPVAEIREAYKAGLSQAFLAAYFDVSVGTIRDRLGLSAWSSKTKSSQRAEYQFPAGPTIYGPNEWLNALGPGAILQIENLILNRDDQHNMVHRLMVHVGGPGYDAPHRHQHGPGMRDPMSGVLRIGTRDKDEGDFEYSLMGPCRRSFDGGKTWEYFEVPRDERTPKQRSAPRIPFRKAVNGDLRNQGLLPRIGK